MFIVAVTLGLLAAMGVYGLAATAADVRAAGHMREAAQSQHAAEVGMMLTSQLLQPGNAQVIVNRMRADNSMRGVGGGENCRSARPFNATDNNANRDAQACLVLTPGARAGATNNNSSMQALAQDPTSFPVDALPVKAPFTAQSFGEVPTYAHIRVELTNPIDWEAPAGNAVGQRSPIFTQVRTTVYVEMRPATLTLPADSIAVGRGRLIVGPYLP